jgi:hypothetical protein
MLSTGTGCILVTLQSRVFRVGKTRGETQKKSRTILKIHAFAVVMHISLPGLNK